MDIGSKFTPVQRFLKECAFKGVLQPIRPRSNDYDRLYYQNNLSRYAVDE